MIGIKYLFSDNVSSSSEVGTGVLKGGKQMQKGLFYENKVIYCKSEVALYNIKFVSTHVWMRSYSFYLHTC